MSKHTMKTLMLMSFILLLVWGCWIPEDFETQIYVNKDGSYRFTYEGKLANVMALSLEKEGKLGKKEESELKKDVEKLKELDGFKSVKYIGKGRYRVTVDYQGTRGKAYSFITDDLRIFSVLFQEENQLAVQGFRPEEEEIKQLNALGVNIEGSLTVHVHPALKVKTHNADQHFNKSNMKSYVWNIKGVAAKPEMVIILQ